MWGAHLRLNLNVNMESDLNISQVLTVRKKALDWLKSHHDVIVKPAEKGGNIMLMLGEYNIEEAVRQL